MAASPWVAHAFHYTVTICGNDREAIFSDCVNIFYYLSIIFFCIFFIIYIINLQPCSFLGMVCEILRRLFEKTWTLFSG